MSRNYAMKDPAQTGKNKGSSVLRFLEVDSFGVPLLPTAVDCFGNRGGIIYEAPWLKTSGDDDSADMTKTADETGNPRNILYGDRNRILTGEFLGNYEELCYDKKGVTVALSGSFGTKTAGVVTLTATAHGYSVGDYVNVNGAGAAAATALSYNGLHKITEVPDANTIKYIFGSDTPAALTSGTVGNAALTVASCSKTAGVVTITTAAAHNYVVGQTVRIAATGSDSALYNGVHVITSVPSSTTFTYTYGTDTDAAMATAGTQHAAFYFNVESLLVSGPKGRQFKVWYFSPIKTALLSTDAAYNKYIYHIGQFSKYSDKRGSGAERLIPFEFTPFALDTAVNDIVGDQIFTKIRVPSIPGPSVSTPTAQVDLMELQVQSST